MSSGTDEAAVELGADGEGAGTDGADGEGAGGGGADELAGEVWEDDGAEAGGDGAVFEIECWGGC